MRVILRPDWTGDRPGHRRRPRARPQRRRGVPLQRGVHAFAARASRAADGGRPARERARADGRRRTVASPATASGMTNFELAQTLVRLGAVTGSALDAGGSSTLAFDGTLLNRPSDPGGERPVSTSLQLMYYGAVVAPPVPVVSPNGDGVDETQRLSYKVVAPSGGHGDADRTRRHPAVRRGERAAAGNLRGAVPARPRTRPPRGAGSSR